MIAMTTEIGAGTGIGTAGGTDMDSVITGEREVDMGLASE